MDFHRLRDLILKDPKVKQLSDTLSSGKKPSTYFYEQLAAIISDFVKKKIKSDKTLESFVRRPASNGASIIAGRTLMRLFEDSGYLKLQGHRNSERSINTLLVFLEIPKERWDEFKSSDADRVNYDFYLGKWFVYLAETRERIEVIRYTLTISREKGANLQAVLHTPYTDFLNGQVAVTDQLLKISFESDNSFIFITASTGGERPVANNILNAIVTNSRESTIFSSICVLRRASAEDYENENTTSFKVFHTSVQPGNSTNYIQDLSIDPIVEYLLRKKERRIALRPLSPSSVETLRTSNENAFQVEKPDYFRFKKILSNRDWFSITSYQPHEDRIYISRLEFTFTDETRSISYRYSRNRHMPDGLNGEMEMSFPEMTFRQVKSANNFYKRNELQSFTVGRYNDVTNNFHATTIRSGIDYGRTVALKEIIFRSENELLGDESISYYDFLRIKELHEKEKRGLIDPGITEWPIDNNYSSMKHGRFNNISGKYVIFFPDMEQNDQSLNSVFLTIDEIGRTEIIEYRGQEKNVTTGLFPALYDNQLKITEVQDRKRREFELMIIERSAIAVSFFQGICLDTNRFGQLNAASCFAIRLDERFQLDERFLNIRERIAEGTEQYEYLKERMMGLARLDIKRFFFSDNRSITNDMR